MSPRALNRAEGEMFNLVVELMDRGIILLEDYRSPGVPLLVVLIISRKSLIDSSNTQSQVMGQTVMGLQVQNLEQHR